MPTNDKIVTFGKEAVACSCCYKPGLDNIDHILVYGNLPAIFEKFSLPVGGLHESIPLPKLLMKWWCVRTHNAVHKLVLQSLPIFFLCWNLWKNRSACKYGGKKSSVSRVKFDIMKDMSRLLHTACPSITWSVIWKDLVHQVMVKTDGSALTNPGNIGDGGILRYHTGQLLYVFAALFSVGTNNQAELQAAIFGITWCIQHGYSRLILEVDSEL